MDKFQISEVFAQNLKALRKSRNQTRNAFAASIDGFASTVQGYEAGAKLPTFHRFCALCNALNTSPNTLLAGLFPWRTELEDVHALEATMNSLHGINRQHLINMQNDFIRCLLETPPSLSGAGFGTRLSILRQDIELEAGDLAERCNLSRSTLQGYESGQYVPSLPSVLSLCEVFGVSPEYLLAPCLHTRTYSDDRFYALRPRQLSALCSMTQKISDALNDRP